MSPVEILLAFLGTLVLSFLLAQRLQANRRALTRPALPRVCTNCQHFDLAEGQAVMAREPNFLKAAAVLGPQQMGRKILRYDKHACDVCEATFDSVAADFKPSEKTPECHVCKGTGYIEQPVYEPTNLPAKARWSEFGACVANEQVVWGGDSCEKFVQLRAKP